MSTKPRILFFFHDAGLTGANLALYRYVEFLAAQKSFEIAFVAGKKGKLLDALRKLGEVCLVQQDTKPPGIAVRIVRKVFPVQSARLQHVRQFAEKFRPGILYFNTVMAVPLIPVLSEGMNCKVVLHVHELRLAYHVLRQDIRTALPFVDLVIANSNATAAFLKEEPAVPAGKIKVIYPSLPAVRPAATLAPVPGLQKERFVVGSCGTGIGQKGVFLFVQLAQVLHKKVPGVFQFVWVGNISQNKDELNHDLLSAGLEKDVIFTGESPDPLMLLRQTDVFVSLSKEESFGLAIAEAAWEGLPVLGFRGTGGGEELVAACGGILVPYIDVDAMAEALIRIKDDLMLREKMKAAAISGASGFEADKIIPGWIAVLSDLHKG